MLIQILLLPVVFLKFWFIEAPVSIIRFFGTLNKAFLQLFSLLLLVRTYFKPWKNEYRKGLVGFSIAMGMFIKTFVIFIDLILFAVLLSTEILFLFLFIIVPIYAVYGLFMFY